MEHFNRFGNMSPTQEYMHRPYLMDRAPFQIRGNLYFVGNLWCSSHLIDTGEGLILLDTPCAGSMPGLIHNIWKLGFNPEDLKYIIVSHAHTDHYACVNALVHLSGAKTFLSAVDAKDMREHPERMEAMNRELGYYNESFVPDVELQDGDLIQLGNTTIRCVLTPGHTIGVMSHFWTLQDGQDTIRVGIYGGAGFVSVSEAALRRNGMPLSLQQDFLTSIDKVWDEPVDLMLGNSACTNYYFELSSRARKWGAILTSITQHVRSVLNNEDARRMLSDCGYIKLLNQAPDDANDIARLLHISDEEKRYIENAEVGSGLLIADKVVVPFNNTFPQDTELFRLMDTNPNRKK